MATSDEKAPGFTVTDRRSQAATDLSGSAPPASTSAGAEASPPARGGLPPVDFSTFALSLGSSALMHLGEVEGPDGAPHTDLSLAKHTIDILAMLVDKTRGNLSPPEEQLLAGLVYDLRLRYVEAAKGSPASR
jgi:hypothetical protein